MKPISPSLDSPALAINGGTPVFDGAWSAGPSHFPDEIEALTEVLAGPALPMARSTWVMELRRELCELYSAPECVTVSSGTTAIHVALEAVGVGVGDEVILSPMTDYGSISGIIQLQAVPVFCDVERGSFNMDPASVEACVTERTRAILAIHIGGYLVDMPGVTAVARRHGLAIVEDVAQAHMAAIGDTYAGCFGDIGAFSVNDSKHMRAGEGGFCLTADAALSRRMDLFADKSYKRFPEAPDTPAAPALNARMSALTAAVARCQLRRLPAWIESRRAAGAAFDAVVADFPLLPVPQVDGARPSYWWYSFFVDPERCDLPGRRLAELLQSEGIHAAPSRQQVLPRWQIFRTLDENPDAFATYRPGTLTPGRYALDQWPNADWAFDNLLGLVLNQYTGAKEVAAFRAALEKIFG